MRMLDNSSGRTDSTFDAAAPTDCIIPPVRVSAKVDYAVRAAIELGRSEG